VANVSSSPAAGSCAGKNAFAIDGAKKPKTMKS
jgi:hypothetical protein